MVAAAALIILFVVGATRGFGRPWTDIGAWGVLIGVLAWTAEAGFESLRAAAVAAAALVALAVALHTPAPGTPPVRILQAALVLSIVWAITTTVSFIAAWRLNDAAAGVLDPLTPAGTAWRVGTFLVVAAGLAAAFIHARSWIGARRLKQPPPGPDGTAPQGDRSP